MSAPNAIRGPACPPTRTCATKAAIIPMPATGIIFLNAGRAALCPAAQASSDAWVCLVRIPAATLRLIKASAA
jgi:hypothetical protein